MTAAATKRTPSRWVPAVTCGLLIAILSLSPSPCDAPPSVPHADKLVHFGMYAVFMLLLQRAMGIATITRNRSITLFAGCSLYGILLELAQKSLPTQGRTGSLADSLANAAGAATAAMIMHFFTKSRLIDNTPTSTTGMEI
jgi:VanZ family protein